MLMYAIKYSRPQHARSLTHTFIHCRVDAPLPLHHRQICLGKNVARVVGGGKERDTRSEPQRGCACFATFLLMPESPSTACWQRRSSVAAMPCGHICICEKCDALPHCPICNAEVLGVSKFRLPKKRKKEEPTPGTATVLVVQDPHQSHAVEERLSELRPEEAVRYVDAGWAHLGEVHEGEKGAGGEAGNGADTGDGAGKGQGQGAGDGDEAGQGAGRGRRAVGGADRDGAGPGVETELVSMPIAAGGSNVHVADHEQGDPSAPSRSAEARKVHQVEVAEGVMQGLEAEERAMRAREGGEWKVGVEKDEAVHGAPRLERQSSLGTPAVTYAEALTILEHQAP